MCITMVLNGVKLPWIILFLISLGQTLAQDDVYATTGSSITISCPRRGSVKWYIPPNARKLFSVTNYIFKNTLSQDIRKRFSITGEFTNAEFNIHIQNVKEDDEGLYKCALTSEDRDLFFLRVIGSLEVSVDLPAYVGHLGESITLGCTIHLASTCSAVSTVYWYKQNLQIPDKHHSVKYIGSSPDNPSLTIKNLAWNDGGSYLCSATSKEGRSANSTATILSIKVDEEQTIAIISVTVFFVVLFLVVFAVIMKKQKPLFLLELVHKFQKCEDDDSKIWDAFVSFKTADEDCEFVCSKLYPKLERELGYKLCIHNKDFLPGKPITSNIIDGILNSRRTILIISKNFLEGGYTTFEYEVAHTEMIKSKHKIIPILLDDITNLQGTMDDTLKFIIRKVTYITWPGEQKQKAAKTFWKRLQLSMPKKASKCFLEESETSLLLSFNRSMIK